MIGTWDYSVQTKKTRQGKPCQGQGECSRKIPPVQSLCLYKMFSSLCNEDSSSLLKCFTQVAQREFWLAQWMGCLLQSFLSCLTQLDRSPRTSALCFLFPGLGLFAGETICFSGFNYVYIDLWLYFPDYFPTVNCFYYLGLKQCTGCQSTS